MHTFLVSSSFQATTEPLLLAEDLFRYSARWISLITYWNDKMSHPFPFIASQFMTEEYWKCLLQEEIKLYTPLYYTLKIKLKKTSSLGCLPMLFFHLKLELIIYQFHRNAQHIKIIPFTHCILGLHEGWVWVHVGNHLHKTVNCLYRASFM